MRAFAVLVAMVLSAVGIGVGAEGSLAPLEPSAGRWVISTRHPTIRVLVSKGCPHRLGDAADVEPLDVSADSPLVPPAPSGGLVCRYGSRLNHAGGLYRATRLDTAQAVELAAAVDAISTRRPTGTVLCPLDSGSATVIAFSYRTRVDADLWFADSGCQTLDNGLVAASEPGNPSFSGRFDPLVDKMSPPSAAMFGG